MTKGQNPKRLILLSTVMYYFMGKITHKNVLAANVLLFLKAHLVEYLHRYHRGHGFELIEALKFFSDFISPNFLVG